MKKTSGAKEADGAEQQGALIAAYSKVQTPAFEKICDELRGLIEKALPEAKSKVWHGSPVWFIDDNPVVGYNTSAKSVSLLFWNGQAFDDEALTPIGKFKAAQATYTDVVELDARAIRRWLKSAKVDIFDSQTFFKNLRAQKVAAATTNSMKTTPSKSTPTKTAASKVTPTRPASAKNTPAKARPKTAKLTPAKPRTTSKTSRKD